jgi:hypothetical protein
MRAGSHDEKGESCFMNLPKYSHARVHLPHGRMAERIASSVRECARGITATCSSPRAKAVALHDFVRDKILFGWTPLFDGAASADTLALGVGHCIPKVRPSHASADADTQIHSLQKDYEILSRRFV